MTYYETIGNYLDFEPWHVRNELDDGGAEVEAAQFAAGSIEAALNRPESATRDHGSTPSEVNSPYSDEIRSLDFE